MNSIIKKILLVGFTLLPACVHYPQHYSYYPGNGGYSSGYIMHRNHYGERRNHYDNGYGQGRAYFPHHQHRDQPYIQPRWGNDYSGHQHQRDRGQFNNGNNHQYDERRSRRNNFDRSIHY